MKEIKGAIFFQLNMIEYVTITLRKKLLNCENASHETSLYKGCSHLYGGQLHFCISIPCLLWKVHVLLLGLYPTILSFGWKPCENNITHVIWNKMMYRCTKQDKEQKILISKWHNFCELNAHFMFFVSYEGFL
jgi:hypothetical protein